MLTTSTLPHGEIPFVQGIKPNSSQKERQQAVVWLAQDVYIGQLAQIRNPTDQLKMAALWRDMTKHLGNTEGLVRIHDLMISELGIESPSAVRVRFQR